MGKKAEAIQVKVRMPPQLLSKVQREAERNGQTLNAEILARLAGSFETKRFLDALERTMKEKNAEFEREIARIVVEGTIKNEEKP
jgi:hypothetical protein